MRSQNFMLSGPRLTTDTRLAFMRVIEYFISLKSELSTAIKNIHIYSHILQVRFKLKAIVLTHDENHLLTDHMIQSYQEVWPSNPFIFRIPYQKHPRDLNGKYGEKVELIQTPADIKQTVLALIQDLSDEEWIYWSVDDKYLVEINETSANNCFKWVSNIRNSSVCGVMFCRCRKLLKPENLYVNNIVLSPSGDKFYRRKNYYQFWVPQFLKTKILRELFLEFPDRSFRAKEMDTFTGQEIDQTVKSFGDNQKMYVSAVNNARFGESTIAGRVTQNCYTSMQNRNISVSKFKKSRHSILIGTM